MMFSKDSNWLLITILLFIIMKALKQCNLSQIIISHFQSYMLCMWTKKEYQLSLTWILNKNKINKMHK